MLELEVLVCELLSVDALSTGAIVVRKIASLTHKLFNHTVKRRSLVAKAFLSGCEGAEVLSRLLLC